MIIWRGWGVLAFVYGAIAMMLFAGLASTMVAESALPFTIAAGLAIAAVATWFTGQALNVTQPQKKIDEWHAARRQQLDALVSSGQFQLAPGQAPPSSLEEARAQSEQLLQHELQQAQRARNGHTLFWIPMQYWAFIFAGIAVVVLVLGIVGVVRG
ncbi:hypothetical protein [Microbacterium sediminis]|uniref:Uncharacterized protein n=1 Tax=Microbacterium sediminis TaxID=904291 RepID=A0A1B9N933_9MICO|nr:hypothetical protein [Microbacterium sediminis]OCG73100.1 hypothetical protein A7J15_09100 [Microbacterium sediminis]QBR74448.1 hypothetical protein E3O41_08585 [Microbacterium sediminis]